MKRVIDISDGWFIVLSVLLIIGIIIQIIVIILLIMY